MTTTTDVRLIDLSRDGFDFTATHVGTASHRQFYAAMEGRCPSCDNYDLGILLQSNWSRFTWAACYDCCWAEWFRATSGPRHHTIYRILP